MRVTNPESTVAAQDVIVIGASAGGVEALAELIGHLPADLPAAVFVVLHIPPHGTSVLPGILSRRGRLPARHPEDGEAVRRGLVYVAPPDHHLLLRQEGDTLLVRLTRGPAENGHRPAVDTLFRSAARAAGPRVAGVILTGTLDDGTAGLDAVKIRGGIALVQDPEEALFSSMPRSAIENISVDYVQPLAEIAQTLTRLAEQGEMNSKNGSAPAASRNLETEDEVAALDPDALETPRSDQPSPFSCPDCHGVLWEVQEGRLTRYRCRVGHAFFPESLLAAQSESLDEALWTAMRALEESAALAERLRGRAEDRGHGLAAARFAEQAGDAHQRAETIRVVLSGGQVIAQSGPPVSEENAQTAPVPHTPPEEPAPQEDHS